MNKEWYNYYEYGSGMHFNCCFVMDEDTFDDYFGEDPEELEDIDIHPVDEEPRLWDQQIVINFKSRADAAAFKLEYL